MDEKYLIEQAGKRDPEAFLTLITPYVGQIYAACREKSDQPEELFQAVFLRAWHGIPLFRLEEPVSRWLLDILEDEAQGKKRSPKASEPPETLTDDQLLRLVRGAIAGENERSSPMYLLRRVRFTLIALVIVVIMLLCSKCQSTPETTPQTPAAQTEAAEQTERPEAAFAPGS